MRTHSDRGATATEYTLLVALFVMVLLVAVDFVQGAGTDELTDADGRVGIIEDTAAYQAPIGPGGPPPPPPPPPPAGTLASPAVAPASAVDDGNKWTARATITVVDTLGQPVAGVAVGYRWSAGSTPADDCVTNDAGQCQVSQSVGDPPPNASVTLEVDSMVKAGWTSPALPVTSGAISCAPLNAGCDQV